MAPKMIQNRAWGRFGARFLRFWEAFGVCRFSMSFGHAKSLPKIAKMTALGGPRKVWVIFWGGSAAEVGVLGRVSCEVLLVWAQDLAELSDTPSPTV